MILKSFLHMLPIDLERSFRGLSGRRWELLRRKIQRKKKKPLPCDKTENNQKRQVGLGQ